MPSVLKTNVFALVGLALATHAHAEGLGPSTQTMALIKKVGVSDGQKQQIYNVIVAAAPQVKAQHQALESVEIQINSMLYGSQAIANDKLNGLVKQKAYAQQALDNINLKTFTEVRQILTPTQLSKLSELHSQLLNLAEQQSSLTGADSVYAFMPQ